MSGRQPRPMPMARATADVEMSDGPWRAACSRSAALAARGDEARKAPDDPDAGFLEFLGSVDRLAEVNPDYLSQADPTKAGKPPGKTVPASPPQGRRRRTPRRPSRCRRVHRTHPEDTTMNNRWRSLALAVLLSVAAAAAAPSMAQEAPPARRCRACGARSVVEPVSRISSGCCRASAASGTRCRRRGSRRLRTAVSAGSA